LGTLAQAQALPKQPVAMLDGHGDVLAAAAPAPLRTHGHVQPPPATVLSSLLREATRHMRGLSSEGWSGRVATPDGPYLLVLAPTPVQVVDRAQAGSVPLPAGQQILFKQLLAALATQSGGKGDPGSVPWAKLKVTDAITGASGGGDLPAALLAFLGKVHPSPLVVMIAGSLAGAEGTVRTVTAISLGGALAVIVLATLLALLVVGTALRPLATITAGAEQLAQGDYTHRLAIDSGADEVGRLAGAFNHMAAAIAAAFAAQRRFVADASHELRTPLTALRGYTDVLLMGVGEEDRATTSRILSAMQEDLGRMSRLVDDLLTVARLDGSAALQRGPVPLAGLLAAAADEGVVMGRGAQRIELDPVPDTLLVWGDRDRLRQVLSNVMGNACAYCPPGSHVRLHAQGRGRWAYIAVEDDGPGIPPGDLARLGERFFRGDAARSRRTGGSGLGLAIARGIVVAHGGSLTVESCLGRGTIVTISLPLAGPELPVAASPGA
jgi:two-component system OmpR family sensor kinase